MKTFEEITWKKHSIPGAIQGLITLSNGTELSIVAGPGMYSTPRAAVQSKDEVSSFEVLAFNENGDHLGDVKGWQSRSDINALLSNY